MCDCDYLEDEVEELRAEVKQKSEQMSRAKSKLRKSVADLNEKLEALTEERDLACELFQGMVSEYADLSDRYAKSCDDYKELASRFVWRNDAEHDKF